MFAEPERTGYDLTFRLFGFPVRVHPWFWLATLLLGYGLFDPDHPEFFLAWIAVAFVSILVHELGHAVAFRQFGVESHVILYAMGGLAVPWAAVSRRWQRVAVALAGPAAGFLFAGVVWLTDRAFPWAGATPLAAFAFLSLLYVNLAWGAVNLLPVVPLDGGKVAQEACTYFLRSAGMRVALQISVATAGAAAVYSLACVLKIPELMSALRAAPWWVPRGSIWTLALFGSLAYQSYALLQHYRWTDSHWDR